MKINTLLLMDLMLDEVYGYPFFYLGKKEELPVDGEGGNLWELLLD